MNPSEEEVRRVSNTVWDGTGRVTWPVFAARLAALLADRCDPESGYRETFRVFSKDKRWGLRTGLVLLFMYFAQWLYSYGGDQVRLVSSLS